MVGQYKVITLCGSTRFKDNFLAEQKRLTLEGNIVISVGVFGHSGDDEELSEEVKQMLDDMHKRKIDMADEIFVINVNGYIGNSTKSEIKYAEDTGKAVKYLVDVNNNETIYTIHSEWHNHMGDLIRSENLYFNDKDDASNRYSELRDNPDVPKGTSVIVKLFNPSMCAIRCFTRRWEETKSVDW